MKCPKCGYETSEEVTDTKQGESEQVRLTPSQYQILTMVQLLLTIIVIWRGIVAISGQTFPFLGVVICCIFWIGLCIGIDIVIWKRDITQQLY